MRESGRKSPDLLTSYVARRTVGPCGGPETRVMKADPELAGRARQALQNLHKELMIAADDYDLEVRVEGETVTVAARGRGSRAGKVTIEARPSGQVWISAANRQHKLDWDVVENDFVLGATGQTLKQVAAEVLSRHFGEDITL